MNTSRLPTGGCGLWKYAHPRYIAYVQRSEKAADDLDATTVQNHALPSSTRPNEARDTGETKGSIVSQLSLLEIATLIPAVPSVDVVATAPTDIVTPVPASVPAPAPSPRARSKSRSKSNANDVDAWHFIVSHVDDLTSLYSDNMIRDAIQLLKDRLVAILSDGPCYTWFGPKKSRILLGWITNNKRGSPASDEAADTVAEFLAWLLGIRVGVVHKSEETTTKTPQKTENSYSTTSAHTLYRKRGEWWITEAGASGGQSS
jgi:hypothetical protein